MIGVHVFEKRGPIEWEEAMICVALLSALSWKRFHGPIHLYTNEEYLKTLQKWGVDKIYDHIDTETLSEIKTVDTKVFWAFGKIYIASKIEEPFVLLDNDLWIEEPLKFNEKYDYMSYHFEKFEEGNKSHYIDFDPMIPKKWIGRWNRKLLVTNTAILWIPNKDLIRKWYETALEIAENDTNPDIEPMKKMIFIEQRLLPMIAHENGMDYDTFVKPVYVSSVQHNMDGSEWEPNVNTWNDDQIREFSKIRHIWGNKKFFTALPRQRQLIFNQILLSFLPYEKEVIEFLPLLDFLKTKQNSLINI